MKVSSDTFWNWIRPNQVDKTLFIEPDIERLSKDFLVLKADQQSLVAREFASAMGELDSLEMWQLCSLVSGQPSGDDRFEYFRRWLVCQGKTVFAAIKKAPDEFCLFLDESIALSYWIEGIQSFDDYLANQGQEEKTKSPLSLFSTTWDWHDSSEEQIRNSLPEAWKKFGKRFQWQVDADAANEHLTFCDVPGLGRLSIGDRLMHKAGLGTATIKAILLPESHIFEIELEGAVKPMRISTDFFERHDKTQT
jgi:hypothetical protein